MSKPVELFDKYIAAVEAIEADDRKNDHSIEGLRTSVALENALKNVVKEIQAENSPIFVGA